MDVNEPLTAQEARELVRSIIATGVVFFSNHALDEMKKDKLERSDVLNVLRGAQGCFEDGLTNGSWRYRFETASMVVVVAFRSEVKLVVVTAWRKR